MPRRKELKDQVFAHKDSHFSLEVWQTPVLACVSGEARRVSTTKKNEILRMSSFPRKPDIGSI